MAYYRAVTYARDERLALAALLDKVGPEAATLCEGWRTADLAAHLVLRERRPDVSIGNIGGPLQRRTARIQHAVAARMPFPLLVEQFRTGPPRLSFFGLPGIDARLNFAEFFVHHEDVRRAQPQWEPRALSSGLTEEIWNRLSAAGMLLRKIPVGIEFARDDQALGAGSAVRKTVRPRTPMVTVIGAPAELMLWTFGRAGAAAVRLEGAEADVEALARARWGA